MLEPYRVIHKQELVIFDRYAIDVPFSEPFPSRVKALEWIMLRGLQAECRVISESLFRQHNQATISGN